MQGRFDDAVDVLSGSAFEDWDATSREADPDRRRGRAHRRSSRRTRCRWSSSRRSRSPGRACITPGLEVLQQSPDFKQQVSDTFRDAVRIRAGHRGDAVRAPREPGGALGGRARRGGDRARASSSCSRSSLLQRWVLRPLATLADGAERIAGGELALAPVGTRAREVAQVGDALSGMAAALDGALGTATAAERERRFLLTAIAHDLRTPLFTLRGSLEAIERGIGDEHSLDARPGQGRAPRPPRRRPVRVLARRVRARDARRGAGGPDRDRAPGGGDGRARRGPARRGHERAGARSTATRSRCSAC